MPTVEEIIWEAIRTGNRARPWVVHGVAFVSPGSLPNPTPSRVGIPGEITSLPYTVPQNHYLVLLRMHHGSDASCTAQAHLKIKVSRPGITNVTLIDNIKCSEHVDAEFTVVWFPPGTTIRVDLVNGGTSGIYIRFMIEAILVNVSDAFETRGEK